MDDVRERLRGALRTAMKERDRVAGLRDEADLLRRQLRGSPPPPKPG